MSRTTIIFGIIAAAIVVLMFIVWSEATVILVAVLPALGGLGYVLWRLTLTTQLFKEIQEEWREVRGTYKNHTGIYLGPITVGVIVRPLVSVVVGLIGTALIYVLVAAGDSDALTPGRAFLLFIVLSILAGLNDSEPFRVPVAHGAILMLFGFRISVYLVEGVYPWIGRPLITRYSDPIPGLVDLKDSQGNEIFPRAKEGFIYLEEFAVPIWNEATDPNTVLSNVARDSSTVSSNLTEEIQILNPRKWVNNGRPIFAFAERARASFRTSIAFFTGVDCTSVKTLIGRLKRGETVVTSFIRKQVGSNPRHSMIQDGGGRHLYRLVPADVPDREAAIERVKMVFREDLKKADPEMYRQILDEKGEPIIEICSVEDHLIEITDAIGVKLHRVHVSDFTLSKPVEEQTNKAAGEAFEFDAQVRSARATKEAREILTPTEEELARPGYEDALMIAAANDNPRIKIVHVTGTGSRDPVTRGFAVGAAVHKGDEE